MDDDATINPEFAQVMIEVFEKDAEQRYAGGMGRVVNWKRKARVLQRLFLMPHDADGRFLPSGAPTYVHGKEEFCETEFVSGGLTFWRRNIIAEYRYDERLSGYGHGEDVDVSYRISRWYKNFYQPKAMVVLQPQPPHKDSWRIYRSAWIQNFYYLALKNNLSLAAFYWCLLGHFLRDLICLNFKALLGDLVGLWRTLTQRIETVEGYQKFREIQKNPAGS